MLTDEEQELLAVAVQMNRCGCDLDHQWDEANEKFWPLLAAYDRKMLASGMDLCPAIRRRGRPPTRPATLTGVPPTGKANYAKLKEMGLCAKCAREPRAGGKSRCAPCQQYARDLAKKKLGRRIEVGGACVQCGAKTDGAKGVFRCAKCNEKRRGLRSVR